MPLKSLRVLDLSRLLPGPYCSMFLADFGAEVIKIEDNNLGDYSRWMDPKINGYSAFFHSINRNKKSITLNLKSDKGKEIFYKLIETTDIVIESFRPGVMDRLGLGYETLKEINPKLIYCAITGFGQDGPYARKPSHDINFLSYAGLLGLQGNLKGPPVMSAVQLADIGGGSQMAVIGILLALQARNSIGKGQFVDISMMDGVLSWMQTIIPDYLTNKELPQRGKNQFTGGQACYNIYETADNRFLSVGAMEEKFWKVFCEGINCLHLIGRLHATFEEQKKMKEEIIEVINKKTLEEWIGIFDGKDACISPVLNLDEVLEDPQVKQRNMIVKEENTANSPSYLGIPIKLSKTPGKIENKAPDFGEHNKEVFEELGYSIKIIEDWKDRGII